MQRRCGGAAVSASKSVLGHLSRSHSWQLPILHQSWTLDRTFHAAACTRQDVSALRKELKDASKASRAAKRQGTLQNDSFSEVVEGWELTVGIEIHAQLNTARKLFSDASTDPGEMPNSRLAPFDLALPGSQPMFQYATLIPALRAALALNCDVQPVSHFDRKHYFYHDQPSGYQITQYYHPFARNGSVHLTERDGLDKGQELIVGLKQTQMEQDTARTREQDEETSLVDFNRAGHPLIEIISLPQIHSPRAAAAYVKKVQRILESVDALMAGLESGGMRVDVNVSVRRSNSTGEGHEYAGFAGLGQRTEIKNLNALKGIEDAVRAERDRQINLIEAGGRVEGETRGWSVTNPHTTRSLRGKEGEVDYRYMPDPDIPPLYIDEDVVQHLHNTMPPLPDQGLHVLSHKYGLSHVDAAALLSLDNQSRLHYFLVTLRDLQNLRVGRKETPGNVQETGRVVGNWVLHELGSLLSTSDRVWSPDIVPSGQLAKIIDEAEHDGITNPTAKQILRMLFEGDTRAVSKIVKEEGLEFVPMNAQWYSDLAKSVIEEFPEHVNDVMRGKHGKIKFLLGQMMKQAEKGKIQATVAEKVLRSKIKGTVNNDDSDGKSQDRGR